MRILAMNKKNIREIFKMDLLTINPTANVKYREKHKNDPKANIYKYILRSIILATVMMLVIYGLLYGLIFDYSKTPNVYDLVVLFILVLGISQSFMTAYTSFYENKDIANMIHMPIRQRDMFLSKILITGLNSFSIMVPMLVINAKFFYDFNFGLLASILLGIVLFLGYFISSILVSVLIIELLVKTKLFYKLKSSVLAIINFLIMTSATFFAIYMQGASNRMDRSFGPLSRLLSKMMPAIIISLLLLILSLIATKFMADYFSKNFYKHLLDIQNSRPSARKQDIKSTNLRKELFKYNSKIIRDSTVINTSIISPAMLPIFSILPAIVGFNKSNDIAEFPLIANNILVIAAMIICFYLLIMQNIGNIIVSLDGENYDYLMTTPLNKKNYLKAKANFTTIIMGSIYAIFALGFAIFLKANPLVLLATILMIFLSAYILSKYNVSKDYKNLMTSWGSVNEIIYRSGKTGKVIKFLVFFFLLIALFVFLIAGMLLLGEKLKTLYIFLLWLIIIAIIGLVNHLNFWKKL